MQVIKENAKALIAFLTALGTWGATASADGIQAQEWWGLCGVFIAGLAVWATTNAPSAGQLEELEAWKNEDN